MKLGEKLQHLRLIEGMQRGLGRPMTKAEVIRAMLSETGARISHPYLCQLESGSRVHMTGHSRELLARFFKVMPGYLVDDPEGFETSLRTEMEASRKSIGERLERVAERLRDEPVIAHTLFKLSRVPEPSRYVMLLDRLLEMSPEQLTTAERALEALQAGGPAKKQARGGGDGEVGR